MAKISPFGKYRAFDSNGDPLNGGKLYTYINGTTTAKDTYTTQVGDVANTNPVILDANGHADVWLGSGSYKFVLKDSADVTQWTTDDILGSSTGEYASSVLSQSSNLAMTATYQNYLIDCTASLTISLQTAATATEGFLFIVKNTSTGNVTIDPDGSELIDGAATLVLAPNEYANIVCTGTAWTSFGNVINKNNFAATAAPTATDDSAAGYSVGSRWIDVTNDKTYTCVDATATAAIWNIGGGAWTVISSTTLTATATAVDITSGIDSSYTEYQLQINDYIDDGNGGYAELLMQIGGSFQTSNYRWISLGGREQTGTPTAMTEGSGSDANIRLTIGVAPISGGKADFVINFSSPDSTTTKAMLDYKVSSSRPGNGTWIAIGTGYYDSGTAAFTGLRFQRQSSFNIGIGTSFTLLGRA